MNVKWLKAAGYRALRTAGQTFIASIGTSMTMGEVKWSVVGSTVLLATILSIATSVATKLPELEE